MLLQVLRKFVNNCFQEADNNKVTSIAIPPIGVGKLGFDPRFVASVMREEAFDFSRRNPQTSLKEVRFVVYQKDSSTIQVKINSILLARFTFANDIHIHETRLTSHVRPLASSNASSSNSLLCKGPLIWNIIPTITKNSITSFALSLNTKVACGYDVLAEP